jgi:hypothetical protein
MSRFLEGVTKHAVAATLHFKTRTELHAHLLQALSKARSAVLFTVSRSDRRARDQATSQALAYQPNSHHIDPTVASKQVNALFAVTD